METLKRIFNFYINGSFHVAFAICALVQVTFLKYEISGQYSLLVFSFFGAITAYNFVKYSDVSKLYHSRITKSMNEIHLVTMISSLLFVYFLSQFSFLKILYLFPFVILTILYVVPVFPNKKNLRNLAGVKIFIIALIWAGTTVLIPVAYSDKSLSLDFWIEIIQRFLFIVVMMLPFEIRDLQYDDSSLETVPQRIGVTRTKIFGSVLLGVFLFVTIAKDTLLTSVEILSTILITTISLLFLWGTDRKQSQYYCSFWVESIPIFWLFIMWILQYILT